VIKKFNLPSFQPLTETQRENKMIDAVGQVVAQAFVKSATVMGNTVHNAVVKTIVEGTFSGHMGPCYKQQNQMQYVPLEVSVAAALSAQNSQAEASNSQAPPQITTTTATVTTAPVYTTTPPIPTVAQGEYASVFPRRWNPTTGHGMPPELFTPPPKTQFDASATQLMTSRPDPSATQPMGSQQDASAAQLLAQFNALAPPPMTPQQCLAILLQPKSPTEILLSQSL
jgi:hypothetical protein